MNLVKSFFNLFRKKDVEIKSEEFFLPSYPDEVTECRNCGSDPEVGLVKDGEILSNQTSDEVVEKFKKKVSTKKKVAKKKTSKKDQA